MTDHVKVRVEGESLWAKTTDDPHIVILDNLPISTGIKYGDKVRIDDDHNILEVIESTYNMLGMQYDSSGEETLKERWERIVKFFETEENIRIEGMCAGIAMLAVPKSKADPITDDFVEDLVVRCPEDISIDRPEHDETVPCHLH